MIEMALSHSGNSNGATTAHRLLAELKPRGEDEENTIGLVEGFIRLATGDKSEIERAIIDFTSLANSESLRYDLCIYFVLLLLPSFVVKIIIT